MQGNFLSFIAKVWQKMVKAKIPTIILHENTGILNVIAHLQSYSSGFLRRQQKFTKDPSWLLCLFSKFQINWEISAIFFGLLRKLELYILTYLSTYVVYYRVQFLRKLLHDQYCFSLFYAKGQIISKGLFGVFNTSKKRTKNFCPSRLGQKIEFSSSFFERIDEDTAK